VRLWSKRVQSSQADCSLAALFYADDGEVAGYEAEEVQQGVDKLLELCEQFGLTINASKTKAMVTGDWIYRVACSSPAYRRRWTGEGLSYSATKHRKVSYPVCDKALSEGTLPNHLLQPHGQAPHATPDQLPGGFHQEACLYTVNFPLYSQGVDCPMEGCPAVCKTKFLIRRHFAWQHPTQDVHILEEGS
jgi:hypothetical protein